MAAHARSDVKQLALQKWPNEHWPRAVILDQIKARQKAETKLASWKTYEGLIYPPADTVEQASSGATSIYKASLVTGQSCADLTAGCGVDSWALGNHFKKLYCVERESGAASLLEHNLKILRPDLPCEVHNASAEEFICHMPAVDLIYIDPQRRDDSRRGLFKLEDCSPNILDLLPALMTRTKTVMIKTSPMISIDQALAILPNVQHIHVVEWDGQCKEILFIIKILEEIHAPLITAVRLHDDGSVYDSINFHKKHTQNANINYASPLNYLYEPSAAYQKADAMTAIAETFACPKLAPDTHLFTSDMLIENFPGRRFEVTGLHQPTRKKLPFSKANLTVRNFPDTVENLRKKLKLADGGEDYLFACTLQGGEKIIVSARKI